MLKEGGGHKKFWGNFYAVSLARSFCHVLVPRLCMIEKPWESYKQNHSHLVNFMTLQVIINNFYS